MADTAQERIKSLEQRLSQNPQSPLFARLAAHYLQNGRAKEALRLCDDGLAHCPFYSTAHLIKGKALVELGMMAEAKHEYDVVHELLPMSETATKLSSSIDLGPSQGFQTTSTTEEIAEAESPAAIETPPEQPSFEEPEPTPVEEPDVEATTVTEEHEIQTGQIPSHEFATQEPLTVEPTEAAQSIDSSFGFGETQTIEAQPEEPGAGEKLGLDMQPEPQQQLSDSGFGANEQRSEAPVVEERGIDSQAAEQHIEPSPPAAEPASPPAEPAGDWYEAFSQLQQPAEEAAAEPASAQQQGEEENPFAMFGAEESATTVEGEPYEEFTARVRMELFGTEETMTLEEYLGQTAPPQQPAAAEDNISELAEKLKTSQRITPPVINFSEKAPRSAGETDSPGASGFVTPTLAEIYVKQGWYDDAIKAYRALATNKPAESEKFQQRIAEIEEMKKK